MRIRQPLKLRIALFSSCALLMLLTGLQPALARDDPANNMHAFMDHNSALQAMLPAGATITKREEKLDEISIAWADEYYGITLDRDLHAYYLAYDKTTGKVIGAAMIIITGYRDGKVSLAVGIDHQQNIIAAAVIAVNKGYMKDFEGSIGTGLLPQFKNLSLFDFMDKTKALLSADRVSAVAGLREAAVLLITYLRGKDWQE